MGCIHAPLTSENFKMWIDTIDAIYIEEVYRHPENFEVAHYLWTITTLGYNADDIRREVHAMKPVEPPKPPRHDKTRDEMLRVNCNFCNLRDSAGRVIFSPGFLVQDETVQNDWIAKELAARGTHYVVSIEINFDSPSGTRVNLFEANRHDIVRAGLNKLLDNNLTPVVFFHSGDSYPGDDYFTRQCEWWRRELADFINKCVFVCGWETRRHGGYGAYDFNQCNNIMHDGLPDALLAFHGSPEDGCFGSNDPNDTKDPWIDDDEPGNWKNHSGRWFNPFLYQSRVARDNELDEFGQPAWWDRCLDTCERFLPAGTPMPGAVGVKMYDRQGNVTTRDGYAGGPKSADWFGGSTRERPTLCIFEIVAYDYYRNKVSQERVQEVAQKCKSFGFTNFGNGIPE